MPPTKKGKNQTSDYRYKIRYGIPMMTHFFINNKLFIFISFLVVRYTKWTLTGSLKSMLVFHGELVCGWTKN